MAGIESEEFNKLRKLLESVSKEAIPAMEMAAAQVYEAAAKQAAPVDSAGNPFGKRRSINPTHAPGQLKESIRIIVNNRTNMLSSMQGNISARVFVSPEKRKGYYGFWLEKGWTSVGPRRRARKATITTHSQRGASGGRKISGRPWFEPAIRNADSQATSAAESAFEAKVAELDSKG